MKAPMASSKGSAALGPRGARVTSVGDHGGGPREVMGTWALAGCQQWLMRGNINNALENTRIVLWCVLLRLKLVLHLVCALQLLGECQGNGC